MAAYGWHHYQFSDDEDFLEPVEPANNPATHWEDHIAQPNPVPLSPSLAAAAARLKSLRDDKAIMEADAEENNVYYAYQMTPAEREAAVAKEMGERLERLKREEEAAALDVRTREAELRKETQKQNHERPAQLAREQIVQDEITNLFKKIAEQQIRYKVLRNERTAQERALQQQEADLAEARLKAAAKKEESRRANKEYDEHPSSLAIRYSRACTICLSTNPRKRAALIACGHMMCATCAEQMSEAPGSIGGQFPCPYCRKMTGFVRTFEDPEEVQASPPAESRKRKASDDDDNGPSSSRSMRFPSSSIH